MELDLQGYINTLEQRVYDLTLANLRLSTILAYTADEDERGKEGNRSDSDERE